MGGRPAISNSSIELTEIGLWIAKALVQWVEGLDSDADAAVAGLSFMNEPAHLSVAKFWKKPWARESQVLQWLSASAQYFRASALPRRGKKLYVQIIETA